MEPEELSNPVHHMIAGSFAGVAEHFSIYPLDTIKTHKQAVRVGDAAHTSSFRLAHGIVSEHGFKALWRGVSIQVGFCGPAHALMFASYEMILSMGGTVQGSSSVKAASSDEGSKIPSGQRVAAVGMLAGMVSTMLHDLVMVPADTVKQRLQLGYYRGPLHCLTRIIRSGNGSLYRSLPTTLATNIPYGGVMMATNESIKRVVNPSGAFSLPTFMLSAGFSGALAGLVTTPFDVVKTRLQTQSLVDHADVSLGKAPKEFEVIYDGFGSAARALLKEEGVLGFTRGAGPRMLMFGPSCAVSWGAYESAKEILERLSAGES